VFNGDTAYITQLKQQKSKRCYYLGAVDIMATCCKIAYLYTYMTCTNYKASPTSALKQTISGSVKVSKKCFSTLRLGTINAKIPRFGTYARTLEKSHYLQMNDNKADYVFHMPICFNAPTVASVKLSGCTLSYAVIRTLYDNLLHFVSKTQKVATDKD